MMRKAARILFTLSALMLLIAVPFRLYLLVMLIHDGHPILRESILIGALAGGALVMMKLRKRM